MPTEKIKLAILESKYGGSVTGVNDLVIRLDPSRFDVTFIYLGGDPATENHLEKAGYKVCYLSSGKRMNAFHSRIVYKLVRILKKNDIDILHCHAHKATQYGAIAGFFARKVKILGHVHGLGRSARLIRKSANFMFLNRINRFLTVAASVKDDLVRNNWRIPASKVTVLENSVDYEKFSAADVPKNQTWQSLNIPQDGFVFGAVGRLAPTKGISYLIEAFAQVQKEISNAYLLLVGTGPDEAEYRQLVNTLNIQDCVCFAGFRKDIAAIFHVLDVFVISSIAEGMPRVLLEAMAAGVPCVGTKVGGIPEVIDDSLGLLVEAKDSDALAGAMTEMIRKNTDQMHRLGTTAKERARTRYSHTVVSEKLNSIYLEILGRV